jgi:hypothetical protein
VQLVREAVEGLVLPRVGEIEDVLRDDADVADARAGGFQFGKGWNSASQRARLLRAGRPACPGEGRKANEQAIPN